MEGGFRNPLFPHGLTCEIRWTPRAREGTSCRTRCRGTMAELVIDTERSRGGRIVWAVRRIYQQPTWDA